MKKNIGIILKNYYPQRQKISVLDRKMGKIQYPSPKNKAIPVGSLIGYYVEQNRYNFYKINQLEILNIPFETATDDILFLHHVLEICYYFIPCGAEMQEIFNLLMYLYSFPYKLKYIIEKKLFLFKLFVSLGIFPEGKEFQTPYFHALSLQSIDTLISKKLPLGVERDLNTCLQTCIQMHPMFRYFKTVNFLKFR